MNLFHLSVLEKEERKSACCYDLVSWTIKNMSIRSMSLLER